MPRIIIGNALAPESVQPLKVGLSLAKKLNHFASVIHSDKLADFDSLDTVFASMNLEIHQKYVDNIMASNEKNLEEQIKAIDLDFKEFEFHSRSGAADDVLVYEAEAKDVDLVVLGHNSEKSWAEKFLGGVTESILHRSEKSVLVVKNEDLINPKKVMLAYDFSFHCDEALNWAKKLIKAYNVELHLINVLPCYYEGYYLAHEVKDSFNDLMNTIITDGVKSVNKRLEEVKQQFATDSKIRIKTLLDKEGSISDQISLYAKEHDMDLILLGSHKRGKIGEIFLGSVALKVLKKSHTSVLIAK